MQTLGGVVLGEVYDMVLSSVGDYSFQKYDQKNLQHAEQGVLDVNHNLICFTPIYEPCPNLTLGIVFGLIVMKVAEMIK